MNVTARICDHTNTSKIVDVKIINVWIGRENRHHVCHKSICALLEEAKVSGRITVDEDGSLDAYDSTPLYTNGQKSVRGLYVEEELIWGS